MQHNAVHKSPHSHFVRDVHCTSTNISSWCVHLDTKLVKWNVTHKMGLCFWQSRGKPVPFAPIHSTNFLLEGKSIWTCQTRAVCADVNLQGKTFRFGNLKPLGIQKLIYSLSDSWGPFCLVWNPCFSLTVCIRGWNSRRNRKWAELETMVADKHTIIIGIYVLSIKLIVPSFVTFAHLFTIIKWAQKPEEIWERQSVITHFRRRYFSLWF